MSSLTEIYDVGDDRAARLTDLGFGSVEDVATADLGTLTTLDGVGRARAEKIRYSASRLTEDPTAPAEPSTRDGSAERQERVTDRDVAAGDVVVVVPGRLLVTDVGGTGHRELLEAGVVSVPGGTFVDGGEPTPRTGGGDLSLDAAVVCFPAPRLAVEAPTLYEAIANLDDRDEPAGFPGDGFLGCTVTAVDGGTLLGLRDAAPGLESDVVALLRRGTVFLDGRSFDFDNPHEVSVLQSGGLYAPGSAALPEGTLLADGTVLSEERAVPDASVFDTAVTPVDGTTVTGAQTPVLRQCGVLLPPGSTRTR